MAAAAPPSNYRSDEPEGRSDAAKPAYASRTVLLLFFGPLRRPDGISAFLQQAGVQTEMIDNLLEHGGGDRHDLLLDSVYS
eukprot:6188492-Pleurochrysis_carterae.AAC.1